MSRAREVDSLKAKNAALEAQIARAMAAPIQHQRPLTREEKIAQSITGVRNWALSWGNDLRKLLEKDAASLTPTQVALFTEHLAEVDKIRARVTTMYARMLEQELTAPPQGNGIIVDTNAELDAVDAHFAPKPEQPPTILLGGRFA